jgi:membrane protein
VKNFIKVVYQQLEIAFERFGEHRLTDWAAALTYYSVLSIFPGLLALVSLLGLLGHGTTDAIINTLEDLPEGPAQDILVAAVTNLQGSGSAATTALIIGVLVSLYSASSYVGAFIRAEGVVLGVKETRRFFVTIPLRYGLTLLLMLLAVLMAMAIVLTGPIAEQFTKLTGIEASGWGALKWPIVLVLFMLALGILYSLGPNFERTKFRFITPGTVLAFVIWAIASILFSVYVGNFGRYNEVYGSLGGVAVFLIWLYLSNVSLLMGLEFDAELARYKKKYGHHAFSRQRLESEPPE